MIWRAAHGCDCAQRQRLPVHDDRVHLDPACAVQHAAYARVKRGIVFHNGDGFFDRVYRRSPCRQNLPAGFRGDVRPADMIGVSLFRDFPGSAVNNDFWFQTVTLQT